MAAVYNQEAGNATLYVDGVAVTAQTSIQHGGVFSGDERPLAAGSNNATGGAAFSTALRVGAGPSVVGASDGTTGFVGIVDEVFVYGTALNMDELDYLFRAQQVRRMETGCASYPLLKAFPREFGRENNKYVYISPLVPSRPDPTEDQHKRSGELPLPPPPFEG